MLYYLWASLLVIVNGAWLFLTLLGLPGNWLLLATTAAFAWWHWPDKRIGPAVLIAAFLLAITGELLEFLAGAYGARRAGGSKRAALGAILGAITGGAAGTFLLPVPLLGTLAGASAGACIGAVLLQLTKASEFNRAVRTGLGAGLAEIIGINAKFLIGLIIWTIVTIAAFA